MIVGFKTGDDAGVYRITDQLALVQTVDFITPLVDDPYLFGQIAAANSLSDVYAMGGVPITAMNVLCLPLKLLGPEHIGEILAGGESKIKEAGAFLLGGHTIESAELVYGLSVTGTIHPDKVITNKGARPGDLLVLTKPIGSGLVNSLIKVGKATMKQTDALCASMVSLNKDAGELMAALGAHAATDVTGFGLVGHAAGMLECDIDIVIDFDVIPLYDGVIPALASRRTIPAGTARNYDNYKDVLEVRHNDTARVSKICCDPQTSGGMLVALDETGAQAFIDALAQRGVTATVIGKVVEGSCKLIIE